MVSPNWYVLAANLPSVRLLTGQRPSLLRRFFEDDKHHIVLGQAPNLPIYGWLGFKLLALIPALNHFQGGLLRVSAAFLFLWAYLEMISGVSYFRKSLGIVVFILSLYSFFK